MVKSSVTRPVRTETGLGNPSTEFFSNDVEAVHFMVNYGLHFDREKPHVFIDSVKDVIETQYRSEDRAVFGKGLYGIRKGFELFLLNDLKLSSMTAVQRLSKVKEFQKEVMRSQKDYVTITAPAAPQGSELSVTVMESGITKMSIVILATMLEKANELLWHEDLIVKKPGVTIITDILDNDISIPLEKLCLQFRIVIIIIYFLYYMLQN